jgi:hypothetical protein
MNRRTLALLAVLVPLAALFVYVALRSGPQTPIPVTVTRVEARSITPALFGIGTIEVRYTNKIGPTVAGRVKRVDALWRQVCHAVSESGYRYGEAVAVKTLKYIAPSGSFDMVKQWKEKSWASAASTGSSIVIPFMPVFCRRPVRVRSRIFPRS